ncbi:MAG: SH3 domain-containing protein [Chloroflexi bacterium]|nr:SH3 domain-containing protein [Chloroflexota bacterium]
MRRHVLLALIVMIATFSLLVAQDGPLRIGGTARVYVEDEGLGLLSGPGLRNKPIATLPVGTVVEIIGGPAEGSGYVWWNVRTLDGREGWSVEGADGLVTLIPIAEPQGVEVISELTTRDAWAVSDIVWSPDNTRVAINTSDYFVHLADVETGEIYATVSLADQEEEQGIFWSVYPQIFWSADGQFARLIEPNHEDLSVVLDASSGEILASVDVESVEWLRRPERVSYQVFVTGNGTTTNASDLLIAFEAGTLLGGETAMLITPGGIAYEMGDGSGGLLWQEGSNSAVIWNNPYGSGDGLAEVWDLTTFTLRARVRHYSQNSVAGGSFPDPAFLSHDGSKLAGVVSSDPSVDPFVGYTITFYEIIGLGEDTPPATESSIDFPPIATSDNTVGSLLKPFERTGGQIPGGEQKVLKFTVQAGYTARLVDSDLYDLCHTLDGPDGLLLDASEGSLISGLNLPISGTYTLTLVNQSNVGTSYNLFLFVTREDSGDGLRVGDYAEVYSDDEGLNLRNRPGTNRRIREVMWEGMFVEIIGGPESNEGYVWWNVRTPSGQEGWAVESTGTIQTLIPIDSGMTALGEPIPVCG